MKRVLVSTEETERFVPWRTLHSVATEVVEGCPAGLEPLYVMNRLLNEIARHAEEFAVIGATPDKETGR